MDNSRLKKIGADLEKARAKREEWDAKVKDLERKYREAENTCIHDMVRAANLTPEQLSELIRNAWNNTPPAGREVFHEAENNEEHKEDEQE